MRRRPPRTAFFGLFGAGNFGNEASLSAGITSVRAQDDTTELWCICANPDLVATEHGIPTVSIWSTSWQLPRGIQRSRAARLAAFPVAEIGRWIAAIRFARQCDRIIVPGTGILDDFGSGPRDMPSDLFRWTAAARIAGTPFAFVAVGAGPIEHNVSRWLMRRAARMATYRSYRDPVSRSFMEAIGSDVRTDPVVPDVVFALECPDPPPAGERPTARIGLGVMEYYGWSNDKVGGAATYDRYLRSVRELTRRLVSEGHSIRLLIGEQIDQTVVDVLTSERSSPDDVVSEPIGSFSDLLTQIQQTDAVIATRYHNVVAALLMERPTVSVGYATKNVDLMRTVGLEQFCQHVDDFDVSLALDQLRSVSSRKPEIEVKIQEVVAENRRMLADQFAIAMSLRARARSTSRQRTTKGKP